MKNLLILLVASLVFIGCAGDSDPADAGREVDENGKPTFLPTEDEEITPGKTDRIIGNRGLPVSVDQLSTSVWEVSNAWEDTDTAMAKEAGMAWSENSGLTWDEKYVKWVQSMEKVDTEGGYYARDTFKLKTPWGVEVGSPALECAEVAIFLRITFASWYQLPFFLEGRDREGRIFFGHFGMRREGGKFGRMPNFKTKYKDYSDQAETFMAGGEWPSDSSLKAKAIPGSFDDAQPMIGEDAHTGAYFDHVFLNKRVGHFLVLTLAWFGSVNLADSNNTFNVVPEHVKAGDVLLERWQSTGIGHTLVVKSVADMGSTEVDGVSTPQLEVELASGSMPRRQSVWEGPAESKRYFEMDYTGGPEYGKFHGGLKRWRIAKNLSGRWTNVVSSAYSSHWINSSNTSEIEARTKRFGEILVQLQPEEKRDVLLGIIETKRQHLEQFPASCSARINREGAFDSLYTLMSQEFDKSQEEVDLEYRVLADYVFAELAYGESKTCCWNRSTRAMYEIAMDYNIQLQSEDVCVAPVPFMNRDDTSDGYELFRQHAISLDREQDWRAWSEDESCPQRDVPEDTLIADEAIAPYCSLGKTEDPVDPVDPTEKSEIVLGFAAGAIPDNDEQGFTQTVVSDEAGTIEAATLQVDITHTWIGDLEIEITGPDGVTHRLKESDGDNSDDLVQRFDLPQLFGLSASGDFTLTVRDTAGYDVGNVNAAQLELTINVVTE